MTEARSQHRLGIALVVAASHCLEHRPVLHTAASLRFLDHPVLARVVRRRHDHGPDGVFAGPRQLAGSGQVRHQRLAGGVVFDGDDRLHPARCSSRRRQCRDHHSDRPLPRGGAGRHDGSRRIPDRRTMLASAAALVGVVIIVGGARAGADSRRCPRRFMRAIAAMTVMVRRHRNTPMIAAAALSELFGSAISLPFAHGITSGHRLRPARFWRCSAAFRWRSASRCSSSARAAAVGPGGADLHAGDAADAVLDLGGIWRLSHAARARRRRAGDGAVIADIVRRYRTQRAVAVNRRDGPHPLLSTLR